MTQPERFVIRQIHGFPGNSLPALLWRAALPANATAMLARFAAHGWTGGWRNGIYDFDHFHSTAHEVLGCAAGWVDVSLGAGAGPVVRFAAGDVLMLPAGTAHRNVAAAPDLLVVGAYDRGRDWDLRRGDVAELPAVRATIAALAPPARDPVDGTAFRD